MKSIAKVKQQARIRRIPNYCDNRKSKNDLFLDELVQKGQIVLTKPAPRRVDKSSKRIHRTSNI